MADAELPQDEEGGSPSSASAAAETVTGQSHPARQPARSVALSSVALTRLWPPVTTVQWSRSMAGFRTRTVPLSGTSTRRMAGVT
jgi:hypothetical protein